MSFQEKYAVCWVESILAGRLPDPAARCASFTIVVIPSDFIDFEVRNREQGGWGFWHRGCCLCVGTNKELLR